MKSCPGPVSGLRNTKNAPSGDNAASTPNVMPSRLPSAPSDVVYRATDVVELGRIQPHAANAVASRATATKASRARRREVGAGKTTVVAVVTGQVNAGLRSASTNAFALSKRSAGIFSNALARAAETCGGTALRNS